MTQLEELLKRADEIVVTVQGRAERLLAALARFDAARSNIPFGLGSLVPHPTGEQVRRLGGAPAEIRTGVNTWTGTCSSVLSFKEAARQWKSVRSELATPLTDSISLSAMGGQNRGWDSPGGDVYGELVRRTGSLAEDLESLLGQAAAALEQASDKLENWFMGALVNFALAGVALVVAIDSAIRAVTATTAYFAMYAATYSSAVEVAAAVAATPTLVELGWLIAVAVAAAVACIGASWAVAQYVSSVAEGAAAAMVRVVDSVESGPQWRTRGQIPGSSRW